ncbi:carbohydrate ABC transporter permease [Cellulomonas sp. URHE0023]|uniref:carbohydrate ABC transporter permease n=1 Tax=Cellulomonas sp. URHE0023 TaxID=1380354 RepID=UPI000480FF1D|nr:sugar ABC transporter permease [Cellulomonas sp. URHE0023]
MAITTDLVVPVETTVPTRPRRSRTRRLMPYLLVAPAMLVLVVLLGLPILQNLVMSLQHFGLRELVRGGAVFVGLENYTTLLSDGTFWEVVLRTLVFTAANVVLVMVLSTAVALLLTHLRRAMRVAVMSSLVVVWAMPIIAATTVWQWLFQSRFGIVNALLVGIGLDQFDNYSWLANGSATFGLIVALIVWQSVPFAALTLYAGLTTVPDEIFEAARMDGAAGIRLFRTITFPVLRPMFGLITSLEVIWVFKAFTQIWAISEGGPNDATTTLPVYAYKVAQALHRYDLSGAISVLTVVMLTVLLLVYFRQTLRQEAD